MTNKTFRKMTKKDPFRGFKKFRMKYLTKQRFYAFLAKLKLVKEVNKYSSLPYYLNLLNSVNILEEKIETERGVFNLSFCAQCDVIKDEEWYEGVFSKRCLHKTRDLEFYRITVQVHSECEMFEVRLSPFTHTVVSRNNPRIMIQETPKSFDPHTSVSFKKLNINFLNARLAVGVSLNVAIGTKEDIEWGIKECVQKAKTQMQNYIESNSEEINEKLTGVKADGEFVTPDGQRLLPNCICRRCGTPVFKSSVDGYTAQCVQCDEDLYGMEIDRVDPERYKDIYENNKYNICYHLIDNRE